MYCLREFAKHYYDRFHSPQRMFTDTKLGFLVLPLVVLFLVFSYFALDQLFTNPTNVGSKVNFGMALLLELMAGVAYAFAKGAADKKSIYYVNCVSGRSYKNISQAKMFYLKSWLEKESLHVGETVNNINLAIGFIENDGYFFSPRPRSLSDLVFSQSASARIISLFIALSAIILTLSVRNGANLEYVFAFYDIGFWRIVANYAVVLLLVVGIYFSLRQIIELIYGIVKWVLAIRLNEDFGGVEVLRIFARDLMFFASDSLYENGGETGKNNRSDESKNHL